MKLRSLGVPLAADRTWLAVLEDNIVEHAPRHLLDLLTIGDETDFSASIGFDQQVDRRDCSLEVGS